jgi:hypothetical protein
MKRNILMIGLALSVLALLAYGVSAGVISGAQDKEAGMNAPQLEGTWRVTVTPPPGGPPAYPSFASFAGGGVLITAPDPSVGPSVTSTGQGTWVRTQANQFASTHVAFRYDAGGNITGTIRIKASYQLTGKDSFEGNGQLQICDASLNNCFTFPGCSTLRGERINAEPPSCQE